jgi:hypothetical protein
MSDYSEETIRSLVAKCLDRTLASTARGRAFEKLFCYLLDGLPGIVYQQDTLQFLQGDEVDIAVANSPAISGLGPFPTLFLVEAKNWDDPVDSASISAFIDKLRDRHIELGILVVARRVTGSPQDLRAAHYKAASAQTSGYRLLLLTMDELTDLKTSGQFAILLVRRLLSLAASGTFQLDPA